ncbi:MAG TPA: transglutaminase domain-containing protein [Acidimicrobiales bacterium]|nr:transglutaminase domain-containing protein [Acidimicrobiales bacterium]
MTPAHPRVDTHAVPPTRGTPAFAPDVLLLAVSLAAGLGTGRLTQAPGAAHVVGPIVATVVAGHLATSVTRRLGGSVGVAMMAGTVVVALTTVWGQLLSATRYGVPTPGTWRTLISRFEAAGTVIRSHPTPVPATTGVVLCIATGAGLVAVASRGIWSWREGHGASGLVALVPSFGLFSYTALLSSQVDRVPGAVAYLGCALGFVIVADHATSGAPSTWRATIPAVLVGSLAVVVPLAAVPVLTSLKVDALPFSAPGGKAAPPGLSFPGGNNGAGQGGTGSNGDNGAALTGVRAIDLVDNLRAVLVNRTAEVMFRAQTPLPTYWQLAVLTRFNGTTWLPDPTTQAAVQSIALAPLTKAVPYLPALPEPPPTKTYRAQVTIADLESTLLPLPPTTVSVGATAEVVPGFGAVQPVESSPGLSYVAVARIPVVPTTTGSTRAGAPAPAESSTSVGATALAPYLQLPTEPAPVITLAHRIVAGAKGPAAQAAALARWFDNGRFRYTLTPPPPTGGDALESFLFDTRAGFCQQFAAAYAVLARIVGLPTRVAVGFTTGASAGRGQYVITGADAHVWPEVYLGPQTGWTSYEPTPSLAGQSTGVGVNSGLRPGAQGARPRSTATTASTVAPVRHPFTTNVSAPSTTPLTLRGTAAGRSAHHTSWSGVLTVGALGAVLVALAVVSGVWLRRLAAGGRSPFLFPFVRRRRRRRRREADPSAEVVAQWREAETVLERVRLGRRPTETLEEHAARLRSLAGGAWLTAYRPVTGPRSTPDPDDAVRATVDAYGKLAALAARASYGIDPCTPTDADDAEALGEIVRGGLTRPVGRRVPAPF